MNADEEGILQDFLLLDPEDYLAWRLLTGSRPPFDSAALDAAERAVYVDYLARGIELVQQLPESSLSQSHYASRLRTLAPDHEALGHPPRSCDSGSRWEDPITGRVYECGLIESAAEGGELTAFAFLPRDPSEGDQVTVQGRMFGWNPSFIAWLPADAAKNATATTSSGLELRNLPTSEGSTVWAGLAEVSPRTVVALGEGGACPDSLVLLSEEIIDWTHGDAASFLLGILGKGVEGLVLQKLGEPVLAEATLFDEAVPLGQVRQRAWKNREIVALCTAPESRRYGKRPAMIQVPGQTLPLSPGRATSSVILACV